MVNIIFFISAHATMSNSVSKSNRQRRWHQKRKQKMRQLAVIQNSIASGAGVNREKA
jgi:hypothetical protein